MTIQSKPDAFRRPMIVHGATLNCKGRLVDLSTPRVMGIINATPDSFFDGGRYNSVDAALFQTEQMLEAGVTFLDIGGMSTRPGAKAISESEELQRVLPIIEGIALKFPDALLSLDTYRSRVAAEGIAAGVCLINDISGGQFDPAMWQVVQSAHIPYILMHTRGMPDSMQQNTEYPDGMLETVLDYFIHRMGTLKEAGLVDVVLDPGFCFGKSLRANYQLLNGLSNFQFLEKPIMVGISRKSMVYKVSGGSPDAALFGSTALHLVALQQGARILRVHDVGAAMDVIKVWQMLESCKR